MGKSRSNKRGGYVLYIGGYLDESIVAERGLPTYNKAGTNHLRRIAEAIRTSGQQVLIISSAVSMRIRWMGQLVHPLRVRTAGKVPVLFCTAVGLPVVGMLLELFFLLSALENVARRRKVVAVMMVNFSPALVIVALWVRLFWRVPIIHNIEDVSVPRWADWLPSTEARPVQQLVLAACMALIARLSDRIIIPTEKFRSFVPAGKPCLSIMPSPLEKPTRLVRKTQNFPINLLYAGKVEFEHGIQHFLRAVNLLSQHNALAKKVKVDICGDGLKAPWVVDFIKQVKGVDIKYHGFVSDEDYKRLLLQADVCFALQAPDGRYAEFKTPSKAYEFLGFGKMVIATDVGDLALLPPEVITICQPLNEQSLFAELAAIVEDPKRLYRQSDAAARYSKEHFSYPVVGSHIRDFILG